MKTAEEFRIKALRASQHADAIDAKARLEYRSDVLDKLWLESNRCRSNARRWLNRAYLREKHGDKIVQRPFVSELVS